MLSMIKLIGVTALALFANVGVVVSTSNTRGGSQSRGRSARSHGGRTSAHSHGERSHSDSQRKLVYLPEVNKSFPELYGPDNAFYEAESLDYFKNEMNKNWFEWLNPDEIQAGGTTCGYFYPDLGLLSTVNYPVLSVYVCARFANLQPASRGNLFVHCGGPGSLSSCTNTMIGGEFFSAQNLDEYNIWSIDQRGMGRSWPSFAHDECSINRIVRNSAGEIEDVVRRDEDQAWLNATGLASEDMIKLRLQRYKSRARECWTVPDFNMNKTQPDGSIREFHFLEHSGTRHLAQDIFVLRHLMNAPKIHLYGISYGTTVFSTYATLFPTWTGLFVLDSNTSPNPDHYHVAMTKAAGLNNRINYVLYSCSANNAKTPGYCPVADLRECVSDINAMFRAQGIEVGSGDAFGSIQVALRLLFRYPERAEEICSLADAGAYINYSDLVDELYYATQEPTEAATGSPITKPPVGTSRQGSDPSYSQPTSSSVPVYGNPDYNILAAGMQIPIALVRAQDRAGAVYDEDYFAKEVLAFGEKYTGAGTGRPQWGFFSEYAIGFYWPKSAPLPPAGAPLVSGIIVGLLYDSATPYVWAQEMKSAFPYTNMLTSQATNHGLGGDDKDCQARITSYFETGEVDFADGLTCGDDFASLDDFIKVFLGA